MNAVQRKLLRGPNLPSYIHTHHLKTTDSWMTVELSVPERSSSGVSASKLIKLVSEDIEMPIPRTRTVDATLAMSWMRVPIPKTNRISPNVS